MNQQEILQNAFAMPFTSPAYPKIDFRFFKREFFIITYETDMDAVQAVVPEPLQVTKPIVKFEFIHMPDAAGFGSFTESGQVIPVEFNGVSGGYSHAMFLNDLSPIAGGREIWGFPKKYAHPKLSIDVDTLLGTLHYNSVEIARGTMAYKYKALDNATVTKALTTEPNYLLKIIPNCNGKDVDICQLVRYYLKDVNLHQAWTGPAALELFHHAVAPVATLPVKKVISGTHLIVDLTLGFGEVIHDYLKK